jgi:hypothetical protein
MVRRVLGLHARLESDVEEFDNAAAGHIWDCYVGLFNGKEKADGIRS